VTIALFDPSDDAYMSFDWSDSLGSGVTVSSVTHSVQLPLVKGAEDSTSTTSAVKLSGAVHGGLYLVSAEATLSNGEVINRQFPIRGWNS
jgi:hypothetical protein